MEHQHHPINQQPNHPYHHPAEQPHHRPLKKKSHVKATIGVLILISILTGFFFLKNYFSKKTIEEKLLENQEKPVALNEKIPKISPQQAMVAINNADWQIIDLRENGEFALFHLESSINLPLSKISQEITKLDKKKKIILIDRADSQKGFIVANHLFSEGLNINYLEGGITAYINDGYPLINFPNPKSINIKYKTSPLTVEEAIEKIKLGKIFKLVDVRSKEEHEKSNLSGLLHIPLGELEEKRFLLNDFESLLFVAESPVDALSANSIATDLGFFDSFYLNGKYSEFIEKLFAESYKEFEKEQLEKSSVETDNETSSENLKD